MQCPNCHEELPDNANFCNHCSTALTPMQTRKASKTMLVLGTVLVAWGIFYFVKVFLTAPHDAPFDTGLKNHSSIREREPTQTNPQKKASQTRPQIKKDELTIGLVTIKDISGNVLSRISVPVISGGWLALPVKSCYGGYNWSFSPGSDIQIDIEWGILQDHDDVGLWWIDENTWGTGPELAPWSSGKPLNWVSTKTEGYNPISLGIEEYTEQGHFAKISMPKGLSGSGVFIQDGRIVGWSFDQIVGGYLWTARKGNELTYDFRVEDFYRLTFANSREEKFILALAGENGTDSGLLAALAEGFRLESKLSEQNIPSHLRSGPIIERMRTIIARLVSEGNHQAVSDIFDSQILINARNPSLLADVIQAVTKSDGYENALWLMGKVRENTFWEKDAEISRLDQLHVQLYMGWLTELMDNKDIERATLGLETAKDLFPEDPALHLLGVRLALEENDWKKAERLLFLRKYPESLQDMVKNLDNRISKLKSQEGKIAIRFTPGSNYIPVTADLNGTTRQKFIIDTGATLSTIPLETARDLGIRIDYNSPIRTFYTAGGTMKAPEAVLSSIEIGNWVVHDIRVLVVDLPRQRDLGLLGLNYLNNFHMNLDAEEGILTLEPQ